MLPKKISWVKLVKGIFILLCVELGFLALVPWFGLIWHVVSGNSIATAGVSFKVPARYLAKASPTGNIDMWQYSLGAPIWDAPFGFIRIHPDRSLRGLNIKRDIGRLRAIEGSAQRSEGMNLLSQRVLDTGAGSAVCFQARAGKKASVTCYLLGDHTFMALYDGDVKFAADVYDIVASARPVGQRSSH